MRSFWYLFLFLFVCSSCINNGKKKAVSPRLVRFEDPWKAPYRVDSIYRHQFINEEGSHLYPLNKTAWAYFLCEYPEKVIEKAKKQGVNVLRVCLEGTPYFEELGLDLWPWGGSRGNPDWNSFNESYWNQVEDRVRLAGLHGIGFDVVLYFSLKPHVNEAPQQEAYWDQTLSRLGKYSNLLTWEIMNEEIDNEDFQDMAGTYFKGHDPYMRPVCTSDGTTDNAIWPHKIWMDLAVVHTCTGNQDPYDLEYWYLNIARNIRQYGKPAFNNESGREFRHGNDDPVHRRKQAWLWTTAGAFWTWHSWEGCEGINDTTYYGPGWEYLKPMADLYRTVPFWKLEPSFTSCYVKDPSLIDACLSIPDRSITFMYCCSRETGDFIVGEVMNLRLKDGTYQVLFLDPANMIPIPGSDTVFTSESLRNEYILPLPDFRDDLLVQVLQINNEKKSIIEGTQ